jgi:hypothetical protein
MRFRLFLILFGAALVALTFTFPLWEPLLQTEAAASEQILPGLTEDELEQFAALLPEQRSAYLAIARENPEDAAAMIRSALAPGIPAPEDMRDMPVLNGPIIAATGEFTRLDAVRWGLGTVTIYQQVDNSRVMRFEEFSVANGPGLRVVLSADAAPETVEDMQMNNLDLDLGPIIGTFGNQHYNIPPEVDLRLYRSVVIYSPTLEMIYATAPLTIRL